MIRTKPPKTAGRPAGAGKSLTAAKLDWLDTCNKVPTINVLALRVCTHFALQYVGMANSRAEYEYSGRLTVNPSQARLARELGRGAEGTGDHPRQRIL